MKTILCKSFRVFIPTCLAAVGAGCASPRVLESYYSFASAESQGSPVDYIQFLRQTRFVRGELDNLPRSAVIFYGDVSEFLKQLGYQEKQIQKLKLGTSDPTVLHVVRTETRSFLIVQGLPGGGGVSTQAAELAALGAKNLVHIGTCAGLAVADAPVFVATASFKDGAAVLLSANNFCAVWQH